MTIPDLKKYIDKVKKMEKNEKMDLSSDEDLSIGIMNLISIEEHLFFTANKTGKNHYYDLLFEIREIRKSLLKKIIKDYEGEVWCISKHLLASSMRLMEVGTKMLGKGEKEAAQEMFAKSYKLYSLFWGLNLGLINSSDMGNNNGREIEYISEDKKPSVQGKNGIFDKLGQIVQKVIDCCKE